FIRHCSGDFTSPAPSDSLFCLLPSSFSFLVFPFPSASSTPPATPPNSNSKKPPDLTRDTISSWESSSRIRKSLEELRYFAEPECPSKRSSSTSRAEKHSKTFWRVFLPSRVKWPSPLSKKQNTFC